MSYEILIEEEGVSILHITEATFNSFEGWRIEFHDGKYAMVYKCSGEWLQYNEDWLHKPRLLDIGKCIEGSLTKKPLGITESYFYDMLIN
jgi:hypothetical protein